LVLEAKLKGRVIMRVLYGVLLVALLSACATSTGTGRTDAKDQVAAATAAWRDAYNTRDSARITAMYDSDAVLWGTTAKTVAPNPNAIAEYFKDAGKRPNARVVFGEQHLRVYGDVAVNTGYYTFTDIRDGKEESRPARFTMVFRNRAGKWLVVAHHSSRVP
jgi:uncharacterized protein (TIGR02246 family)